MTSCNEIGEKKLLSYKHAEERGISTLACHTLGTWGDCMKRASGYLDNSRSPEYAAWIDLTKTTQAAP